MRSDGYETSRREPVAADYWLQCQVAFLSGLQYTVSVPKMSNVRHLLQMIANRVEQHMHTGFAPLTLGTQMLKLQTRFESIMCTAQLPSDGVLELNVVIEPLNVVPNGTCVLCGEGPYTPTEDDKQELQRQTFAMEPGCELHTTRSDLRWDSCKQCHNVVPRCIACKVSADCGHCPPVKPTRANRLWHLHNGTI